MKEIWKDIPNYEGLYKASNLGNVKRIYANGKERFLKTFVDKKGYCNVYLCKNKKIKHYRLHKLIMITFVGNKELSIDHIDCNKQNNRLDNLEYVTQQENCIRAWSNGLCKITPHGMKKVVMYDLNDNYITSFQSICEASRQTNIAKQHISLCCKNKQKYTHNRKFKFVEN